MAVIIDGKQIAQSVKEQLKCKVSDFLTKYNHQITLAVILVGENPASKVYVKNKIKATEYVGMKSLSFYLPSDASFEEVSQTIKSLAEDDTVDGILVQLPLPKHLDENKICDNCGKCIQVNDVASIKIDKIYTNPDEYKE